MAPQQQKRSARSDGGSLLKWIGNKQRMAGEIAAYFPPFQRYFEPFLGAGAVLGALAPRDAVASDSFRPLMEIWSTLKDSPHELKDWYAQRWQRTMSGDRRAEYESIKATYNAAPNGADLTFLCRACYGGVVRFRKADGFMSTPIGPHRPIEPAAFERRVDAWATKVRGASFEVADYSDIMDEARDGDLIYCDPPYAHTQTILYGAQAFRLPKLLDAIDRCTARGVNVALSIDGSKRSGEIECELPIPSGLFKREIRIQVGRSMLKRFQMEGRSLGSHVVHDRLLLTY